MGAQTASVWPAEQHPTRWEAVDAHQVLSISAIERFRTALMHGEGDAVSHNAASLDLDSCLATPIAEAGSRPYTYPLIPLYGLQALLSDNEHAALCLEYCDTFGTHVYVNEISPEGIAARLNPPYLQLALNCISSAFSDSQAKTQEASSYAFPEHLFQAGSHIWLVMMEVDRRETRSARAVIAIIRRIRMTDDSPSAYTASSVSERHLVGKSVLLCYVLLIDTIHALQSNTAPNYSISELSFCMPQSGYPFQMINGALLHGQAIPNDLGNREDALALSIALLSNIIQTHKMYFGPLSVHIRPDPWNPYRPLTWRSELTNTVAVFNSALARWESHFLQKADHDVLALHYFTKLYLMVPSIAEFPSLARGDAIRSVQLAEQMVIPDEAWETAWDVFEHVDLAIKVKEYRISIWLPEIIFLSAVIVWRSHSNNGHRRRYGGLRSLVMYQNFLLRLPWPCCREMAAVLDLLSGSEEMTFPTYLSPHLPRRPPRT
ncbi:hypothetical protein COCMIDRAFT_28228 [Bipolaris oryzae ATCC 44560]|uniref:Transcription factor domain-containing protein n=1 Tax=Bipolaris oryzae ATCC 44560 TaxID=930090 RepID=W6YV09_COCMI|nr:uncharacterized protein COCMIDRAFT_28228 [Bipolaris oryzae ATCC 44560]EUC43272.1 hypothetical protein COCMIDRAFT_28228 [Bipolaris oryzae ATCC 44560]